MLRRGSELASLAEAKRLAAAGGRHANVVQAYATALEPDTRRLAIVMKRRQASLQDVLHCRDNAPALGALQRETVAFQLASGLPALHDSNVLHRDVQSSNALLIINAPQCGGVQACWSDSGYMSGDTGAAGYLAQELLS